jgi:tetratricopeptide (TPR) repeat protein
MTLADVLVRTGDLFAHSGKHALADAHRFAAAAVEANPSNADALALLAKVNGREGNLDTMAMLFERAMRLEPHDAMPYVAYADAITHRIVPAATRPEDGAKRAELLAKALTLYAKAAKLDSDDARAWSGIGTTLAKSGGDPNVAIKAFRLSFRLAPPTELDAFELLQLYVRTGRRTDAQQLMEDVIKPSGNVAAILAAQAVMEAAH